MTDPLICTPDEIIGPAIVEFVSLRPNSLRHINYGEGVYSYVFAGWRAQASLALRRLAFAAKSNRLGLSEGTDLRELVSSEFNTPEDLRPTTAVGEARLIRTTGSMLKGTIPKGTRFLRPQVEVPPFPLAAASYESIADVTVATGSQTATVLIRAVQVGSIANSPLILRTGIDPTEGMAAGLDISDTLFDTAFTVSGYTACGGSDGATNADIRRFAKAFASGQYGPTMGELVAGCLRNTGAKHIVAIDDQDTAQAMVYIADQNWASGDRWASIVEQSLHDNDYVGFGCSVSVQTLRNIIVNVVATVRLRDKRYLSDTSGIDSNIRKAVRGYFDDRPDWNVWKTAGLRAAIARADRRILSCPSAIVRDSDDATMAETTPSSDVVHYYLADNAVTVTYQAPI